MRCIPAAAIVVLLASSCADGDRRSTGSAPALESRRAVVWLSESGLDELTAAELARVGIDEVVIRRGVVDLTGEAPVLRFAPKAAIAGDLPVGLVLEVEGAREGLDAATAAAVWRAVAAEEAGALPAEILLDLPDLPAGTADFVARLAASAGVPVVPVLSVGQLGEDEGRRVAAAAGRCVVPAFGTGHEGLRGAGEGGTLPLARKLEPLAGLGVGVRIGIGMAPVIRPALGRWGDDLGPLTEPENAEVRTTSELDRSFVVRRPLDWSGRRWSAGETVAVRWWDVSRLHASLAEIDRVALPEVVGWDLVPLPPTGARLGIGEEALFAYLAGEGPAPELRVELERSGGSVRVTMANTGPFSSAVSGVSNWLEIAASQGSVLVSDRGSFDSIELGIRRGGEWQAQVGEVADAVRFRETCLGPAEQLTTGWVRLTASRAELRVRWHVLLSSGAEASGELAPR
jgi:hypothetical protein